MKTIFSPDILNLKNGKIAIIEPNKINFVDENGVTNITKKEVSFELPKNVYEGKNSFGLTILPTYDCNLRCIYCYSNAGEMKQIMGTELVKEVLNFYSKIYREINLRFTGGGEPFLNFELMKYAVDYAKKIFNKVSLHTITNGTFNDEQFNWLKNNHSFVRISFDSLAQKNQRRFADGKDSTEIVINNIKRVVKSGLPMAVQLILTSESINDTPDLVKFIYDLGVRDIKFEPVYITESSRGKNSLMIKPKIFAQNFLETLKMIRKNNWDLIIDTSLISRPTFGYYCNMPSGNLILTPEGNITSCVEISKGCDNFSDLLLYGKWDKKKKEIIFDNEKMEKLRKFHFTEFETCSSCNLKLICRGGCPIRRLWKINENMTQQTYNCMIRKLIIPEVLKLISEDEGYAKIIFSGYKINNEKKT